MHNELNAERPDALHRRLHRLAYERCVPLYSTIEITLSCNLRCVHCYNFDRTAPQPKELSRPGLSPDELLTTIDALADAGCLYLYLTGGESTLHPHVLDFIRRGRRRHMRVGLKTNGTLLSPERTGELVAAGAENFEVSLYGMSPASFERFTARPGSFDEAVAGARAVAAAGAELKLSYCLTRHNAHEVELALALADELGASIGVDPQLTKRYDGTESSLDHRVDTATLEALYRGPLRAYLRDPDHDPERSVQCSCARAVCGISAAGDVYPCIGAPIPSGNLREQPFAEIWRDSRELNRIRALSLDDFQTCKPCPDRAWCRRSSGVIYANTGEYTGVEQFTCDEAAALRRVLGAEG